jgi:hypothetical protein
MFNLLKCTIISNQRKVGRPCRIRVSTYCRKPLRPVINQPKEFAKREEVAGRTPAKISSGHGQKFSARLFGARRRGVNNMKTGKILWFASKPLACRPTSSGSRALPTLPARSASQRDSITNWRRVTAPRRRGIPPWRGDATNGRDAATSLSPVTPSLPRGVPPRRDDTPPWREATPPISRGTPPTNLIASPQAPSTMEPFH